MRVVLHQRHNLLGGAGAAFGIHRQRQLAVRVKRGDAGAGGIEHIPAVVKLALPADHILVCNLAVLIEVLRYRFGHLDGLVDGPGALAHQRVRILQTVFGLQVAVEHDDRGARLALEAHIAVCKIQLVAERHVAVEGVIPPIGLQPVERGNGIEVVQRPLGRKRAAVVQAGIDDLIVLRAAGDDLVADGRQHRAARTRGLMQTLLDDLDVEVFLHEMVARLDGVVDAGSQLLALIIVRILVFHILGLGLVVRIHTRAEDGKGAPAVVLFLHIVLNALLRVGLRLRGRRADGCGGRARLSPPGTGREGQHKQQQRRTAA